MHQERLCALYVAYCLDIIHEIACKPIIQWTSPTPQKRMEYYASKTGLKVSSYHLRHTMATQLLNAEAEVVTIQDVLGHNGINPTERYCSVSNLKVMRDYFKAMEIVMQRTTEGYGSSKDELINDN